MRIYRLWEAHIACPDIDAMLLIRKVSMYEFFHKQVSNSAA